MSAASPLASVTEELERIAAEHGFTAMCVGLNIKQRDSARYDCDIHFDDPKPGGTGCVLATGASIGAAVNNAYRQTLTKRLEVSVAIVSEAA